MPTGFVKKLADKKGMSTADAEAKWEEAKKAVDKSKYSDDNSYYAVVTTVFKKMMGEEMIPGTILNFDEFLTELFGFSRSEFDANRQMGSSNVNTAHVKTARELNPYASVDKKAEERKMAVHGAAMTHVRQGNHKKAFDAAYSVAKAHAKEDRHSDEAAHEIATRKAKHAVKTAQDALKR